MNAREVALPPRWLHAAFWTVVAAEWAVAVTLGTVILVAIGYSAAVLAFACTPDTTVYASGYSEPGWTAVRVGDTQGKVRGHLGEPLDRWRGSSGEWWSYSQQTTGTENYRERKLLFAIHGEVAEKHEACYID
jgi:hypothetical protein